MKDSHFPASNRTIMVVDDHPDQVDILRITLEWKGFNVKCAYSVKDLFAFLEKLKPYLILLDIMMPQMDGVEVLTRLRENSDPASIPVIFLTATALYGDVIRGYKMGAEYYFTKPIDNTQLLQGINSILS